VVGLLGALGEPRRVRVEEWDGRGVGALGHDLYKKGRGPALRTPPLLFLPLFTRVRRREILRHEQRAVEPVLVSEKPGRLLGNRLHSDRRGRGCGHDRCHGRCCKRGLSGTAGNTSPPRSVPDGPGNLGLRRTRRTSLRMSPVEDKVRR
jgi:hypothetical protein